MSAESSLRPERPNGVTVVVDSERQAVVDVRPVDRADYFHAPDMERVRDHLAGRDQVSEQAVVEGFLDAWADDPVLPSRGQIALLFASGWMPDVASDGVAVLNNVVFAITDNEKATAHKPPTTERPNE